MAAEQRQNREVRSRPLWIGGSGPRSAGSPPRRHRRRVVSHLKPVTSHNNSLQRLGLGCRAPTCARARDDESWRPSTMDRCNVMWIMGWMVCVESSPLSGPCWAVGPGWSGVLNNYSSTLNSLQISILPSLFFSKKKTPSLFLFFLKNIFSIYIYIPSIYLYLLILKR